MKKTLIKRGDIVIAETERRNDNNSFYCDRRSWENGSTGWRVMSFLALDNEYKTRDWRCVETDKGLLKIDTAGHVSFIKVLKN